MKTKVNRVLTFLLVAAMIVGSIHLVAADDVDESKQPDLTLTLGQKNVDLTAGINYDKSRYDLAITNDGGFDINVVNDTGYRVEFSLTPKAAQVEEGAGTRTEGGSDPAAGSGTQQGTPQEKVDTPPSADGASKPDSSASKPDSNASKPDSSVSEPEGSAGKETEEASADDQPTSQSLSAEKEADADVSDGRAVQGVAEDEGRADSNSPQESNADSTGSSEKQDENTSSSPSDAPSSDAGSSPSGSASNGAASGKDDSASDAGSTPSNPSGTPGSDASSKNDGAGADDVQNGEDAALPPKGAGDSVDGNGGAKTIWRTVYVVEKHILKLDHWPDANELTGDVVELQFNPKKVITVGNTITIREGQTYTVTGSAQLVDGKNTLFLVEAGGHLILDGVHITDNTVGSQGAVCVQRGGELELGCYDTTTTAAPEITRNTMENGTARNLVIADGADVRLNAKPYGGIGISYAETVLQPIAVLESGRYQIQGNAATMQKTEKYITPDDSANELVFYNDKLIIRAIKPRVLYWAPDLGMRNRYDLVPRQSLVYDGKATNEQANLFYPLSQLTTIYGAENDRKTFVGKLPDNKGLEQFDLIVIEPSKKFPYCTDAEQKQLMSYLDQGGRIYVQSEEVSLGYADATSAFMEKLGTQFIIRDIRVAEPVLSMDDTSVGRELTHGLPKEWTVDNGGLIVYPEEKTNVIFRTKNLIGGEYQAVCVDIQAGSTAGSVPWGNITVASDGDIWRGSVSGVNGAITPSFPKQFAKNLVNASVRSRSIAASGVNPNAGQVEAQAKIGDQSYLTPKAALNRVKARETIQLCKDSGLTPVENNLLYHTASIQQWDGAGNQNPNKVTALTNGANIDVAANGAITLRSGEVNVSRKTDTDHCITVDGYQLTAPVDYTVKAVDQNNRTTDSKASVTLSASGRVLTASKDGKKYEYKATDKDNQVIYLGAYGAELDWSTRETAGKLPTKKEETDYPAAELVTETKPYYLQENYTATIKLKPNYSISDADIEKVWVSMEDDRGKPKMLTKTADASGKTGFRVTKTSTGNLEVTVNQPITGALRYYLGPVGTSKNDAIIKHDMTELTIHMDGSAVGSRGRFTVKALGEDYTPDAIKQGSTDAAPTDGNYKFSVPQNEDLSITFYPHEGDVHEPYYETFTGEKGSTFPLLTKLEADKGTAGREKTYNLSKDPTNGTFADGVKFDWIKKAYTITYKATEKTGEHLTGSNQLDATFEKAHVFRVFLSGGKAEITTKDGDKKSLIHRDHDETGADAHHVIVKDGTSLKVKMTRNQDNTENFFKAYWAQVYKGTQSKGADLPNKENNLTSSDNDATKTYITPAITQPFILNATFEQKQPLKIKLENAVMENELPQGFQTDASKDDKDKPEAGLLARITPTWTLGQGGVYTTNVDYGDRIFAIVKPTKGYQIKSVMVDNLTIDAAVALQKGLVVQYPENPKLDDDIYYIYRSEPIYRSWSGEMIFASKIHVTFDKGEEGQEKVEVVQGTTVDETKFAAMVNWAKTQATKLNQKFVAWVAELSEDVTQIYTKFTKILHDVVLKPLFVETETKIAEGADGSLISAKDMLLSQNELQTLTEETVKTRAKVKAFDKEGKKLSSDRITVVGLDALKQQTAKGTLTFSMTAEGGENVAVTVDAKITQSEVVILGKTAKTLTFRGAGSQTYTVRLASNVEVTKVTTGQNGIGTAAGLKRDTKYAITLGEFEGAEATTLLVDAEEIAKAFAANAGDTTTPNNATGKNESAENANVTVTVGADDNYKITLRQDIQRTVEIPDTWENVTLDLNTHTIKGADAVAEATADGGKENGDAGADGQTGSMNGEQAGGAADVNSGTNTENSRNGNADADAHTGGMARAAQAAAAGLRFIKDAQASRNPGTTLTVVNGTIQGGNGVTGMGSMDGAAGVETAANAPTNAKIIVGKDAKILGGSGANAKDNSGQNGGNGGVGIQGAITVTVLENGIVKGGNGGNGANVTADNETAQPGQGGQGGQGTEPEVTKVEPTAPAGSITNGTDGQPGTDGETPPQPPQPPEDTEHTVTFENGNEQKSAIVKAGEALGEAFDKMVQWAEEGGKKLLAWMDKVKNKVYTKFTTIVEQVKLTPLFYDGKVVRSADGSTIAAKAFTVGKADLKTLTDGNLKELAQVQGYDKDGRWLGEDEIQVTGLSDLQMKKDTNTYQDLISFSIGTEPNTATVKVDVTITEAETTIPVNIIGTTAHTLTIQGRANTIYNVQYTDNQTLAGTVSTDDNGVGTTAHLAARNTSYTIVNSNNPQETVTGSTALVDAKLIAERFAQGETTKYTGYGSDEAATNSNVKVTRGADGNYTAALRKAIQGTIAIPDTWGTVILDLKQHTIQGADATDAVKAQVGLIFIADDDESIHVHPGTTLKVINGTIRGGSGSAAYPNGAPAVSTAMNNARMAAAPTNAKIEVGNNAKLIGGAGANAAKNSSQHGGDGGAGITGTIELLVSGGTVQGGNGGNGADADTEAAKPGNGGSGGVGTNVKKVTLQSGAILGGNGGKGGKASGDNKNPGGTGGAGGDGTAGGGESNNNGGNISGGAGGAGGDSSTGNGGQGGQGGNAGNNNNTGGGTENGGAGGSGGSSESGNGGAGGTGGNSGSGNAGAGGSGGNSNTGQGGAGGDGGSSNTGNGGQGGNGGTSNGSGNGGQGGQGGNSNSGNAGTGGTGGNSNTGQGGNGGNGGQGQKPGAGGNGGTGSNGTNNGSSGKPGGSTGGSTGGGSGSTGGGSGSTGGGTTTKPGGTTTKPGGTTTKLGDSTTTKLGGTTTKPGGTTTKPGGTTTKPSGTTTKPSGTTTKPSSGTNGSGNTAANGSMNGNGSGNDYNNGYGNGYDYSNGNGNGNGYDYSNGYGDGSVPAGSDQVTDEDGDPVDFWHWIPLLLVGGLAGYVLARIRRKKQDA